MLFSSIEFLLFFFPVTLGVHFLLPRKWGLRNHWLLLASLFFYAWGEPRFVLIMMASIVCNYLVAISIERARKAGTKKTLLIMAVIVNLGILFVFKYLNFITATLHSWFPATQERFAATSIALPIGISFFTFQALSYVIDVYRGIPAQKNIGYLGLYISLFPQLIAGPIVRYTTVMDQITDRRITLDMFSKGLMRFFVGFNKKILLANVLAEVADKTLAAGGNSVCTAWLGVLCYSLQIFFDFSGYSDMAIGLGRMFGFRFLENFDYPYISRSITEFWRRWHISLGSWFRDYVYFPMGGSRVSGKRKLARNLLVVWLLTGIWHGANWTFIVWGIMYGILITVERFAGIPARFDSWNRGVRVGYRAAVLVIVMIGWMIFRSDNLTMAGSYFKSMFGLSGNTFADSTFVFYLREYAVFLVFGLLCSTPVFVWLRSGIRKRSARAGEITDAAGYVILLLLFAISFSFLVMNAHNPFIYFNF